MKKVINLKSLLVAIGILITSFCSIYATDLYVMNFDGNWSGTASNKMEGTSSPWVHYGYWNTSKDFKIATSDWSTVNLGKNNANPTIGGSAVAMKSGSQTNLTFPSPAAQGGIYKITVTLTSGTYYIKVEEIATEQTTWRQISAPKIYWDNTAAGYTNVTMINGRYTNYGGDGKGTLASPLTHITNTNLWYNTSINNGTGGGSQFTSTLFVDANWDSWEANNVPTQRAMYATSNTAVNTAALNSNTFLFSAANGNRGATLSRTQLSSGYSELNKAQTIKVYVKAAGGSYTEWTSNWPGTIKPNRYYLSNATTATNVSNTALTPGSSVSVTAVLTSQFKLVESSTATGYTFKGWGTSSSGPTSTGTTYTISAITGTNTIYAFFEENTYTVSFANDGHGTTSPSSNQTVGQITGIAINATPSSGYSFNTWTSSSGGSFGSAATTASNTFYPTTNTTLTASFNEDLTYYTLTFGAGSNGSVAAKNTSTSAALSSGSSYLSGTGVTVTATPATHYKLEGWYSDAGLTTPIAGAGTTNPYSFTLSANTSVYAKFVIKQCTITLDRNGGSAGDEAVTATHGSTLPSFTAHTRTGYTLKGYYTETSGGTKIINADGSLVASTDYANGSKQWNNDATALTLHAQWDIINYTISYVLDGGTNYAGAPTSYNVTTSTITLGTPTKTHYHFDGWTNAGGTAVTKITKGSTGNITLTAHWTKLPMVYLKNTMNWENAYVTFYKGEYWDATNAAGSSRASANYVADPAAMTYNSSTGLFEYECPDVYAYTYACFTKDKQDDYGNFYGTEAIYCSNNLEYEKVAIVAHETNETKNSTKYYTTKTNDNIEFVALASGEGTGWFFPGGWSSWETKGNEGTWNSTNVRFTKSLAANTDYEFKVYNHGVYYGKTTSGTWTASGSKTLVSGENNCTLSTTLAGTYTFDYNTSTNSLTISYPSVYAISGSFNSWTEETNLSFSGNDGSYSVSINGSSTNYEFKVLNDGVWYSTSSAKTITATESNITLSSGGSNIQLKADVYPSGTYTFAYNKSTHKLGVTYPTNYTVTFGKRTGGNTVTAKINNTTSFTSGTKIASGTSVTFAQTAASGYTFEGWYNAEEGGTKLSSSASYTTTISAAKTVYANYTPNNYTVTFDKNGGLSDPSPATKSVTYDAAYGTLPAGPTPPQADQFAGWFTTATGVGDLVTAETIVETASDHTLYARYEHTYTVTVQYKCGTDVLRAQTTTHASLTSVAAEISAPELLGYEFVNWTGDNATFADAYSANTTVNVSAATTVVANYRSVPMVYFKNNLDWDNVYVTFNASFNSSKQNAPSNNGKPYYQMTQLGKSDIFYCVIPSTYTDNDYAGWQGTIAFDNQNYNGKATDDAHTGNMEAFYGGQFLGRGDFDPNATMFIPYSGDTEIRNSGTYYPTGCWLRYNSTNSSYTVRANTAVSGDGTALDAVALTADVAGATEFTAKVWLNEAEHVYGVMLRKEYLKNSNDLLYTNVNDAAHTITSATTSLPWSWQPCASNWQRCRVKAEAVGWYIFTVSFATGRPMVDIEYPLTVGDFRLVYKDAATWNKTHAATWKQISPVFKHKADRVDTASFFVSYGSSPALELQKCTAISGGEETWTKQSDVVLSSISAKGVYNFTVTQNNAGTAATAAYLGAYTGKYYVRTDASDGGWNDYKSTSNQMTYSEYSMSHGGSSGPYSYYYMRHVTNGQNIKFVVANDYSFCLSDTMINDTYASEWIEREANVRFTYNHTNNLINRAYISGSSNVADRFLVLEGDAHLYDADGHPLTGTYKISGLNDHEMKFIDDQNWIYEATVQANPLERIKLTAKFNDEIQYFYGKEGSRSDTANTHQLLGGTGDDQYKMRVVYDFKTNRLLAGWLPTDAPIGTEFEIDADVMIIRYHQADAQQVTFSSGGKLTDVKTVYGAMQFNKYRLNNQDESDQHDLGLSPYERDLFFISFPFDVKLNDVFGFGTYGKHWIIEYYDGKTRAQNGYWKDSPTNWKFVTKAMRDGYTLNANEGYVLALDLDELKFDSPVWDYGVENVYLYFPSKALVKNIQATHATVEIDTVGYQCKINRNTTQGDRRVKDSHWHLIGVPSYANANHLTSSSWSTSTGDLEQTIYYPNIDPADWTLAAPFVYDWNAHDNKFGVVSTTSYSFKPMHSYLVQYARDTLEWRQVNATVASAPRRAMFAYEPCDFRLELLRDEIVIDQAFISMRDDEEVTAEFDFNYDLSKMLYGAFTSKSNIYTFAGNEEVAANCLPFKDETTVVPVGVTVNEGEEGEYIFSIPEGTSGVGVTLVDNERQIRTNLALTDYMTYLAAGEYTERFVLEISPIEQTTTSVEAVSGERLEVSGVCKKLIDGVLYIVKDGKVFDARGARVQ